MNTSEDIVAAAGDLLGEPVELAGGFGAGANSRVLAIRAGGTPYAVKRYPEWRVGGRARCAAEWQALNFLRAAGITAAPQPVACDPDKALLILEWLDGTEIDAVAEADLDQALAFLLGVFALSARPSAGDFPLASEACLAGTDVVAQINARLQGFVPHDALDRLLAGRFSAVFTQALAHARALPDFSEPLAQAGRRLIPADFGFHNALRQADGRIRFFDFDYFGWDDPVKLAADFVLHPAGNLSPGQARRVVAALSSVCDSRFAARAAAIFPLFALRWVLIVLNVFRRDRQTPVGIPPAIVAAQIGKAERHLDLALRLIAEPMI